MRQTLSNINYTILIIQCTYFMLMPSLKYFKYLECALVAIQQYYLMTSCNLMKRKYTTSLTFNCMLSDCFCMSTISIKFLLKFMILSTLTRSTGTRSNRKYPLKLDSLESKENDQNIQIKWPYILIALT